MFNKLYVTFLTVHLALSTTFGIAAMVHEQVDEHEISNSFETEIKPEEIQSKETQLEEIKEITQEYIKDEQSFIKIINSIEPLYILKNIQEKRALAFVEIPKDGEIPILSLEEKQLIKELFQTYHIKKHGNKLVIAFTYQDEELLPETKEQATYLLLAAYCLDQNNARKESQPDGILNEKQSNALGKKEYKPHAIKPLINQRLKINNAQKYEGLSGLTRVKTSEGHSALQDLQKGDMVACYDQVNKQIVYSPVTHTDRIHVKKHIRITINGQDLKVAPNHQFYVTALNEWVTAEALLYDANLCSYLDPNIQDVQLIDEKLEVTRITVASHHNFFITDNNILVHNYIPIVVEVFVAFEIGQGATLTWAILAPTAMALATGLFYWITDKFLCETPRDLSFIPGPMQDYSESFTKDKANIHFYPHGSIEHSKQTLMSAKNTHVNPRNSSVKPKSAHNETIKSNEQSNKNAQNEISVTASPPPLDPKKPKDKNDTKKDFKKTLNKNKEYKNCKNKLNELEKNLSNDKAKDYENASNNLKDIENNELKASKMYNSIRNNQADVDKIAENLQIDKSYVQKVKDYVFYKEHRLIGGTRRFDPNLNIAENWIRLINNKFLKSDLEWFLHEFSESILSESYPHIDHNTIHSYAAEIHNWVGMLSR